MPPFQNISHTSPHSPYVFLLSLLHLFLSRMFPLLKMEFPSHHFLRLLRCPLTRLPLRWIGSGDLPKLGLLRELPGWTGALLRSDLRVVYPVRNGLPILLAEELVPVDAALIDLARQ